MISDGDIANYSPGKFNIQSDIEYMDRFFEETDAVPNLNWKPLFDPEAFEAANKPLSLQKFKLDNHKLLAEGKLVTIIRGRILTKAH